MNNCDDVLHELYEFLDGELDDERRAHIQQHLTDCSPCLEAFDFQAEVRQVIARKCTETVPESLKAKVAKAISSQSS